MEQTKERKSVREEFAEKFISILESDKMHENIHKWIDLVFGKKQSGQEAIDSFNTYHPLSYHIQQQSIQQQQQALQQQNIFQANSQQQFLHAVDESRIKWMSNCGSVPFKVFSDSLEAKKSFENVLLDISKESVANKENKLSTGVFVTVDKQMRTILLMNEKKITLCSLFDNSVVFADRVFCSGNGLYFGVSFNSVVKIYFVSYNESMKPVEFHQTAQLMYPFARFSILCQKQMLCATAAEKVVLWSVSTSLILNIIDLRADCMAFDEELKYILIGSGRFIYVYTINGSFVLKCERKEKIFCDYGNYHFGSYFNDRTGSRLSGLKIFGRQIF